jgi:serine/threonine-protein kinase
MHVVEVYDFGIHDQLPFIVMELLEGESLRARLRRQGTFTLRETLTITEQIAKGLKSAHAAGLIHRDLKPSNVFLAFADDMEIIKLLDFGVVKAVDQSGDSDMTASGTLLGTPQYMSPEQVRARRRIDHRSDLWAFGVIVFRLLTGLNPFRGESVGDAALRICSDELPKLSDYSESLPTELDDFFARAFARDPADRFQTAEELAAAFRAQCAFALSDVSLAVPGQPSSPGTVRRDGIYLPDAEAHGGVGPSVTPPSTSGVSAVPGVLATEPATPHSTQQAQMAAAGGGGALVAGVAPTAISVGPQLGETPSGTAVPVRALAGPGADTGGLTQPYVVRPTGRTKPVGTTQSRTPLPSSEALPAGEAAGAQAGAGATDEAAAPGVAGDGLAIPGTSLRMPVATDDPASVSLVVGNAKWAANLEMLKRRLARHPMPLVLGACGASILLVAILFLLISPGDSSESSDEPGAAPDSEVTTLGRWPLQPATQTPTGDLEVEEQAGVETDGVPDAGVVELDEAPEEPTAPPTIRPAPIKRGTTPASPGKPKDERPKWF